MRLDPSPFLVDAAAAELASREKWYPQDVDAGRMACEEALADLTAWRAIAAALQAPAAGEDGWVMDPLRRAGIELPWASCELATSRALIAQSDRAAARPGDVARAARRDAVQQLHDWVVYHRWYWTRLGERLPPRLPAAPRPLDRAA